MDAGYAQGLAHLIRNDHSRYRLETVAHEALWCGAKLGISAALPRGTV